MTPVAIPTSNAKNKITDSVMRTVSAQTVRFDRLWSRSRNTSPALRLARMASRVAMIKLLANSVIRNSKRDARVVSIRDASA